MSLKQEFGENAHMYNVKSALFCIFNVSQNDDRLGKSFGSFTTAYLPDHPDGFRPKLQVYSVLRFLVEGHYQKGISADFNHCMSQPTFSKYLHIVIPAINQLTPQFIRFPQTAEERNLVQEMLFFNHYLLFQYYAYTHKHTYTHKYTRRHTRTHKHTHTHTHTHIHAHTHIAQFSGIKLLVLS